MCRPFRNLLPRRLGVSENHLSVCHIDTCFDIVQNSFVPLGQHFADTAAGVYLIDTVCFGIFPDGAVRVKAFASLLDGAVGGAVF